MKALNPGNATSSITFQPNAKGEIDAAGFKAFARTLPGIGDIGIVPAKSVPEYQMQYWRQYLASGCQAGMQYLERNIEKRADPRSLLPEARSLIVILCPYRPPLGTKTNPHIALYAQGKDYHKIVKDKLFLLASNLPPAAFRAFCDTAPLLEKYWAWQAGLGYIGRNTLLIHPVFGSFCFIGILLSQHCFDQYDHALPDSGRLSLSPDASLEPDRTCLSDTPDRPGLRDKPIRPAPSIETKAADSPAASSKANSQHPCANCHRCVQACPGHALNPGLDARRCFSYLTIEHKGERPPISDPYWFGCDICQNVCPANRSVPKTEEATDNPALQIQGTFDPDFLPLPAITDLSPAGIAKMEQKQFNILFKESALQRAGLEGLQKNIIAWQKEHTYSDL